MSLQFTNDNFQEEVLSFDGVVLVDFWAEWCTPCKMLTPIIDSLSEKFKDKKKVKIGKIDIDENQETAIKYNVMSIPTLLFIKKGKIADSFIGLRSEKDIEEKLASLL